MDCSGGKASFNAVVKQGSPHLSLEKFYKLKGQCYLRGIVYFLNIIVKYCNVELIMIRRTRMVQVSFSIPEEAKEKIKEIAEKEQRSISWVMRELILESLKNRED